MKNKFRKILYDHYLIIFSILLTAGLSVAAKYYDLLQLILQTISYPAIGWIILFLFIAILGIKKLTKKKRSSATSVIDLPPEYRNKNLGKHKLFEVMWDVWMGSKFPPDVFFDIPQRLWADGPFCPYCSYELDKDYERGKWICAKCNKYFNIPKNIREDTTEKVIKIFEAELRKK